MRSSESKSEIRDLPFLFENTFCKLQLFKLKFKASQVGAGAMARLVEGWPRMHKALGLNPTM